MHERTTTTNSTNEYYYHAPGFSFPRFPRHVVRRYPMHPPRLVAHFNYLHVTNTTKKTEEEKGETLTSGNVDGATTSRYGTACSADRRRIPPHRTCRTSRVDIRRPLRRH